LTVFVRKTDPKTVVGHRERRVSVPFLTYGDVCMQLSTYMDVSVCMHMLVATTYPHKMATPFDVLMATDLWRNQLHA